MNTITAEAAATTKPTKHAETAFMNNNILTIMTMQSGPFRTLLTALKDMMLETNITFTRQGMKIINVDKSSSLIVYVFLPAEKFDIYECKADKIVIGVDMTNFFKIVNTIENNETLTMYVDKKDYNEGEISTLSLKFDNPIIKQSITHRFRLMAAESDDETYPDIQFSSVVRFPSTDFQKIIRIMANVSSLVEISLVGDEIIFKGNGNVANTEIRRAESGLMSFIQKNDPSKVFNGKFSIKYLVNFIKCTNLSAQMEFYLDNNRPLVVQYDVATLGYIRLCLVPYTDDD